MNKKSLFILPLLIIIFILPLIFAQENQSQPCTDSDGGLNILVKGFMTSGDYTCNDTCQKTVYGYELSECYCPNYGAYDPEGGGGGGGFLCPGDCKDGACILPKECLATGTQKNGSTKTYSVVGKNYEVKESTINGDPTLYVNGQNLGAVKSGSAYPLTDSRILNVFAIPNDINVIDSGVIFCIADKVTKNVQVASPKLSKGALYFILALVIIFVLFFIFWLWMLIDCIKSDFGQNHNKISWILIIIFTGIIGAVLYYFLVKRKS